MNSFAHLYVSVDVMRLEEDLILKELRELGLNVLILDSRRTLKINGIVESGSLVLIRNISSVNSIYVASMVEASGSRAVNSLRALTLGHDKILTYSMLYKKGIRIPETVVLLEGGEINGSELPLSFPLVDKPPLGSWGRLVSLVKNSDALRSIVEYRKRLESPHLRVHVIQEATAIGRDIRCVVVGEEVVACMERRSANSEEWRSNAALGGVAEAVPITRELEELALKASEAVEAEIAGVDMLYGRDGQLLVNEVNVVPEFKTISRVTGVNVAKSIAHYLARTLKS
ncbi:MAG: RimK family alpha-L-glutamate ligase [Acidilobaceae archaeon]